MLVRLLFKFIRVRR